MDMAVSLADKSSGQMASAEPVHVPALDEEEVDEAAGETEEPPERQRSTIKFPYNDLEDVEKLAQALHQKRGGHARISELAAELNKSANSGAFRLRLSAARMFGLIDMHRQQVTLTSLGHAIIDPEREAASRVKAFLKVELYKRIYEEFNATQLPEDSGLEARIREFGVTPNQVARARQVFVRSADHAGFFKTAAGRHRLVAPPVNNMGDEARGEQQRPEQRDMSADGGDGAPLSDPILSSLLQRMLPPVDQEFPARDRRRLFTALAVNLDVVYGPPSDGHLDYREIEKIIAVDDRSGAEHRSSDRQDDAPAS